MLNLRLATADDASGITAVKAAAWPGEGGVDSTQIARVMSGRGHISHVAVEDGEIVGFVDGFATLSREGVCRWEVDLLAVHPAHQGKGIGRALVDLNTAAGHKMGAPGARSLIKIDNVGSQKAFARCGYVVDEAACTLYVYSQSPDVGARHGAPLQNGPVELPPGFHLVPVNTFNYSGVWLEGDLSPASFAAAKAICARDGLDVAGAVILPDQPESIQAAEAAGYTLVGYYQWWRISF